MSSTPATTSPTSSSSTSTWSTRSPRPRPSTGLRLAGRGVRRPDLTVATADHNVPTTDIDKPVADPISAKQLEVLAANCAEFGITCYPMGDANQGIVHIIGPEQGLTQPGMTIVCGDSHTSTHGAFGALAFGIGTSEVEHVLATQTLPQRRPATMAVTVDGDLPAGVTAKDIVLAVIGRIGTGGGMGHVIEYRGSAIRALSMEGRMTVCNMSIEAGARAGMIAPDDDHLRLPRGPGPRPQGAGVGGGGGGLAPRCRPMPAPPSTRRWPSTPLALVPHVTWGTNPAQVARIDGPFPIRTPSTTPAEREAAARALEYMGLVAGTPMREVPVDTVFIGSCTNGRIEDLRAAADVLRGRRVRAGMRAIGRTRVPPGQGPGRVRGPGRGIHGSRVRVAGAGLLDVPGHEPRQARSRRAGRLHLEPELRGSPGPGRPHPPGLSRRGRGHRGGRPLRHTRGARLMEAVQVVTGRAVPLDRSDVDTDQIIPSDWLKRVERTGFGAGLFAEWRDDRDFVLNQEEFAGATILVAGPNFGTGSSREHAVWALQDYGFEAVVSPRFARHLPQQLHQGRAWCRSRSMPRRSGERCSMRWWPIRPWR